MKDPLNRYSLDLPDDIPRNLTGKMIDKLNELHGKEVEVKKYGEDQSIIVIDGEELGIETFWLDAIPDGTVYDVVIPDMVTKDEMEFYYSQQLKDWIEGSVTIDAEYGDDFPCVINVKNGRGWLCPKRWLVKSQSTKKQ